MDDIRLAFKRLLEAATDDTPGRPMRPSEIEMAGALIGVAQIIAKDLRRIADAMERPRPQGTGGGFIPRSSRPPPPSAEAGTREDPHKRGPVENRNNRRTFLTRFLNTDYGLLIGPRT